MEVKTSPSTSITTSEGPNQEALYALLQGDLSKLTQAQRAEYLTRLCESLELNPLLKPLEFITTRGPNPKVILYATKNLAVQVRASKKINVDITYAGALEITPGQLEPRVYTVKARARMGDELVDDIGTVWIGGLVGDDLANAIMKAHTKAYRRALLSIAGVGVLDESETDSIPGARRENTPMMGTGGPTRILPDSESVVDAEVTPKVTK